MKSGHKKNHETAINPQKSEVNNAVEKKTKRRSGRLGSLSFRPFSKESKSQEVDEAKTSLLKRLSSRRSFKGKDEEKKAKSGSMSSTDATVSTSDELSSASPGHTPKHKRLVKVTDGQVKAVLSGSTSDTDGESDKFLHCRSSLRLKSNKRLKRSLSLICGSGRSKVKEVNSGSKPRDRRSLGLGDLVKQKQTSVNKENTEKQDIPEDAIAFPDTDFHSAVEVFKDVTPKSTPRRKSLGVWSLSERKNPPKRRSYDYMNRERDGVLSARKEVGQEVLNARQLMRRKWSSFKMSVKGEKTYGELADNDSHDATGVQSEFPSRQSLCRKSLGVSTTSRDLRGSIYGNTMTPTFMTCGFIMTDSPPSISPEFLDKCPKSLNTAEVPPGFIPKPLDYCTEDLPWVAMKRKRWNDAVDRSQVNRSKAGHTPLPPRKKYKSTQERLIE